VSGRTFPVEIEYRPAEATDTDMSAQIITAVDEILTLPSHGAGDILVFLPGERDIREVAKALRQAQFTHLDVLPLYARLSIAEQRKVFAAHSKRRVVLATNVAETSITVPGIGYVIDPGLARVSRYSVRTKVQRLPIEPISQASANQRAGRCGRVSNGVCIRLYSEEDFNTRPEFTDAEIVRTNLAAVILQMLNMGVGLRSVFKTRVNVRQKNSKRQMKNINGIKMNSQILSALPTYGPMWKSSAKITARTSGVSNAAKSF